MKHTYLASAILASALSVGLLVAAPSANAQSTGPDSSSLLNGYDETQRDQRLNQLQSSTDSSSALDSYNKTDSEGLSSRLQSSTTVSGGMQSEVDKLTKGQTSNMLTGDTGLACEAIICLSSGTRPGECAASLARYFSINLSKPWKTIQARLNFLQLCPSSNETPQMGTLVNAIAHGAGRCDAATLNATLRVWWGGDSGESYISNQMPDYCAAYVNHEYTDIDANEPKYVGTPETGGYWVEPGEYAAAQAAYEARMEELMRQREYVGGW